MELSNQEVKPFRQEKHTRRTASCPICDRHLLKKILDSKSGYPAVAFIAEIYIFSNFGPKPSRKIESVSKAFLS